MNYAAEKERIYRLLEEATGIKRSVHPDLEKLADARAREGYLQVGIGPQPDGSFMGITHPTQTQLENRLGEDWHGKGVGEIAAWNFLWNDPLTALVNGWMNSTPHRNVLINPNFKHGGIGVYTFLPQGQSEINRRWYFIYLVSINLPDAPVELVPKVQFNQPIMVQAGTTIGYRFDTKGNVLGRKSAKFTRESGANAVAVGLIPRREGHWAYVSNGVYAGHWLRLSLVATPDLDRLT